MRLLIYMANSVYAGEGRHLQPHQEPCRDLAAAGRRDVPFTLMKGSMLIGKTCQRPEMSRLNLRLARASADGLLGR